MRFSEGLKNLGVGAGGLLISLGLLTLSVMFILGLTRLGMMISPWLAPAFLWTLAASIFICGPLALVRKSRGFAAIGFMIASYAFGAILWITSLLWAYALWGIAAVFIGLVILGIGIVPVALLAVLFHAQWAHLLDLVMLIAATFGTRLLAAWLALKADADRSAHVACPPNARQTGQRNWIIPLSALGVLAALLSIFGHRLNPNENLSATQVFFQTSGSVVRIDNDRQDGSEIVGSGFVVLLETRPYILTNQHVVENASRSLVKFVAIGWPAGCASARDGGCKRL
jgi:MFS family permease